MIINPKTVTVEQTVVAVKEKKAEMVQARTLVAGETNIQNLTRKLRSANNKGWIEIIYMEPYQYPFYKVTVEGQKVVDAYYKGISKRANTIRHNVQSVLRHADDGMTSKDISRKCKKSHKDIVSCLRELHNQNKVIMVKEDSILWYDNE